MYRDMNKTGKLSDPVISTISTHIFLLHQLPMRMYERPCVPLDVAPTGLRDGVTGQPQRESTGGG